MDQRRFLTWLLLTALLFFLYQSFVQNNKPQKQAEKPKAEQPADVAGDPLLSDKPQIQASDKPDEPSSQAEVTSFPASAKEQIVTLGSMAAGSKFNLLVTLSSNGASLERAEMIESKATGRLKFRSLEHDGSYLGYLAFREHQLGLEVKSVPPGSPAALATSTQITGGLLVDDVLTKLDGQPVTTRDSLDMLLSKMKAGQSVVLTISRTSGGTTTEYEFATKTCETPIDVVRTEEFASEAVKGNDKQLSCLTTLASINGTRIPVGKKVLPALRQTLAGNWEVHQLDTPGGEGVEFRLPLDSLLETTGRPHKVDLVKRYRLLPVGAGSDGYTLDLETLIVNRNDEPIKASFRQFGIAGLTLEGWWYSVKISPYMFASAGQRDVTYATIGNGHGIVSTREITDFAKKTPQLPDKLLFSENEPAEMRSLKYLGADAQYFNASFLPHSESPESLSDLRQAGAHPVADLSVVEKSQLQAANVSFWFDTNERQVEPQQQISQRYQIFIGPKDPKVLAAHGLDRAIEYGWFPYIAIPLSHILHFFYSIVRNYGLAIVMLTVLVRSCMFPFSRNAAITSQRMQEMQPELKKINELYKDNMEKRAKATQDLYRKFKFNPLAGCLPVFIQLPIFMGLYRCLSVDISLRQEPLIPGLDWCSNLAGPDMLANWSSFMPEFIAGRGVGWLGPYFNVLPLITVGLFLVQQKVLMPKATDEQMQMTQNMMQIMTIFMGVLFFKVPSGLCIYFITSSIWSLIERSLVKRFIPPANIAAEPPPPPSTPPESKKDRNRNRMATEPERKPTRFEELRTMLEKPAVRSTTQRGSKKKRKN